MFANSTTRLASRRVVLTQMRPFVLSPSSCLGSLANFSSSLNVDAASVNAKSNSSSTDNFNNHFSNSQVLDINGHQLTTTQQMMPGVTPNSTVGIVFFNMGGPSEPTKPAVQSFLKNLFSDKDIIDMGKFQGILGPLISTFRSERIVKQYQAIGGSPIYKLTKDQADKLVAELNEMPIYRDNNITFKPYIIFRYTPPYCDDVINQIMFDEPSRLILFPRYPQFSCTTSGSSLNQFGDQWRRLLHLKMLTNYDCEPDYVNHNIRQFPGHAMGVPQTSLIDRWFNLPAYIDAICENILVSLNNISDTQRMSKAAIVFTSHSLPYKVVNKGDPYMNEIHSTIRLVRDRLASMDIPNSTFVSFQSNVGKLWQGPYLTDVLKNLVDQNYRDLIVVPIGFTTDHIETSYELDIQNKEEIEEYSKGRDVVFHRSASLNSNMTLIRGWASLIHQHIESRQAVSREYKTNCPGCTNPACRQLFHPLNYEVVHNNVLANKVQREKEKDALELDNDRLKYDLSVDRKQASLNPQKQFKLK